MAQGSKATSTDKPKPKAERLAKKSSSSSSTKNSGLYYGFHFEKAEQRAREEVGREGRHSPRRTAELWH
jgi:hypothetical protein